MSNLTVTIPQLKSNIVRCIQANIVPMVVSSPGMGKSDTIREVAAEFNLEVIDVRLAQIDPTELNGYPHIYVDDNGVKRATYVPMDCFPIEGTPLPEGKDGWLLNLDELTSAPMMVQAAAYKIILDREVGNHKLHKRCAIAAAGNLITDNAVVNRMSTALMSRMTHFELSLSAKEWIKWGNRAGVDYRVLAFINFNNSHLHKFDPNLNDKTYPCPRTWHMASRVIKDKDLKVSEDVAILAGTIGEGMAREFLAYVKVFDRLPTYSEIVKGVAAVPSEPSVQFAIASMVAQNAIPEDYAACIEYIDRIGPEFNIMMLRQLTGREPSAISHPDVNSWFMKTGRQLF